MHVFKDLEIYLIHGSIGKFDFSAWTVETTMTDYGAYEHTFKPKVEKPPPPPAPPRKIQQRKG